MCDDCLWDEYSRFALELSFADKEIGDDGAEQLAADVLRFSRALTTLSLEGCDLSCIGVGHVVEALKMHTELTDLNISYNNIGDDGVTLLVTALMVAVPPTLRRIDLASNEITAKGAVLLANAVKATTSLTSLNLSRNPIGIDSVRELLSALKDECVAWLKDLTLMDLGMDSNEGILLADAILSNGASLTKLDISSNALGDSGAVLVAKLLRKGTPLQELNLFDNSIGDEGTTELCLALQHNTNLTFLGLGCNHLGVDGAAQLSIMLSSNVCLTRLELADNALGDAGVEHLAQALIKNTSLRALNLIGTRIKVDGAKSLASMLGRNASLRVLELSGNRMGDLGVQYLTQALELNASLTHLSIFQAGKLLSSIESLVRRNRLLLGVVQGLCFLLIGIRNGAGSVDGMGCFGKLPKAIVKIIAEKVWLTRGQPEWVMALRNHLHSGESSLR